MHRSTFAAVMTAVFVPPPFAAAEERTAKYYDAPIETERKRVLGEWVYPPVYRDGKPFVTLALHFADDGTGGLEYRFAGKTKTRKKAFAYAMTQVGDDRVIVMKGDAFPRGAVFTYRLIARKVMFFKFARIPVAELAREPRNVAGSWFRPGVLKSLRRKPSKQ